MGLDGAAREKGPTLLTHSLGRPVRRDQPFLLTALAGREERAQRPEGRAQHKHIRGGVDMAQACIAPKVQKTISTTLLSYITT